LARAHLIEPGTSYGRWRMHDLLRLYARQLLDAHAADDGREQAGDRLLHYYLDMARAADKHVQARPGTEIPGVLNRGDALVWLAAERLNLIAEITMADNTGENRIAAQLSTFLAHYTEWRRCVNEQLAARRVSLHAVERLAERGYRARARMNGSAAPFELINPWEAIPAYQDAVVIFREVGDRQGEADALNNLGKWLRSDEAVTAHQDAVTLFQAVADRHGEANALNNLGNALHAVQRFEEAIVAHQQALTIFRKRGYSHRENDALRNLKLDRAAQEALRPELKACPCCSAVQLQC
jgi:tetratricopeptide (TPR) repeat protein